MAKRTASKNHRIEEFADDLGRLLGTAKAKAESWLGQRAQITKRLEGIRDTAIELLQQLGQTAGLPRRGRPTPSGSPTVKRGSGRPRGTVRKRRTMSAAARKAISDAQKKRWARLKGQKE